MRMHETTIVGIAELIAAKKEMIESMRHNQKLLENKNINEVFIRVSDDLDDMVLFNNSLQSDELINKALIEKMPWIIDHVYDHAIQMAESKIESDIQQLKLDLTNDTENKE